MLRANRYFLPGHVWHITHRCHQKAFLLKDGGTDVLAVHDGLPPGVPTADNEAGWREALAKLAALVEAG